MARAEARTGLVTGITADLPVRSVTMEQTGSDRFVYGADMSEQARKHQRVARILGSEIRGGALRDGSRLLGRAPPDQRFSVSRSTVREALRTLADEGLVRSPPRQSAPSSASTAPRWTTHPARLEEALTEQGVAPETTVLPWRPCGTPRWRPNSARTAPGSSPSTGCARSPAEPALPGQQPGAPASRGWRGPRYWAGRRLADRDPGRRRAAWWPPAQQRATAVPLNEADARRLGRPAGTSFLQVTRVGRSPVGAVIEHVVSLLDPERFELRVSFGESGPD